MLYIPPPLCRREQLRCGPTSPVRPADYHKTSPHLPYFAPTEGQPQRMADGRLQSRFAHLSTIRGFRFFTFALSVVACGDALMCAQKRISNLTR